MYGVATPQNGDVRGVSMLLEPQVPVRAHGRAEARRLYSNDMAKISHKSNTQEG